MVRFAPRNKYPASKGIQETVSKVVVVSRLGVIFEHRSGAYFSTRAPEHKKSRSDGRQNDF
jgi:hypothetical protein